MITSIPNTSHLGTIEEVLDEGLLYFKHKLKLYDSSLKPIYAKLAGMPLSILNHEDDGTEIRGWDIGLWLVIEGTTISNGVLQNIVPNYTSFAPRPFRNPFISSLSLLPGVCPIYIGFKLYARDYPVPAQASELVTLLLNSSIEEGSEMDPAKASHTTEWLAPEYEIFQNS